MVGDRNTTAGIGQPPSKPVIVDLDGRLAGRALELRSRLATLAEERLCAKEVGLDCDPAYMADLNLEVAETRAGYQGAAILQLAALRGALDGRGQG
jgi:hypothetical protein